ncbi:PREDICTED: coiled-coil domain-containing protein 147-like [Acromyrmex echinatior]|uniref:coiled-coil domain-containing protein 147-like n=1 Tax=Acromyrmex echinatior TaxID=103372 RepID=UPI000580EBC9|nr:PREDICTED: coiled-coil domain-containing protein 147-like [Acromyrmex echinatior]
MSKNRKKIFCQLLLYKIGKISWIWKIYYKPKTLHEHNFITISKKTENLLKEREILIGEMETMRQRMKNISFYAQELEQKNNEANQQMTEMQETIGMQLNEISREKGTREKLEIEMRQLQEEINIKKNELELTVVRSS